MNTYNCQMQCVPSMAEGRVKVPAKTLRKRLRLIVHRHLSYRTKQWVKKYGLRFISLFTRTTSKAEVSPVVSEHPKVRLRASDTVRVRSQVEIESTLNALGTLKGCGFMKEMRPYCNTIQRVLKPVEIFLDERDYQVKKSKGIVLLEGVMCEGTEVFGPCDRSCFFFWREEWLEKLSDTPGDRSFAPE